MHVNNMAAFLRKIYDRKFSCVNELEIFTLIFRNCALLSPRPNYFYFSKDFKDDTEKSQIILDMKVYEDFINKTEENSLVEELEPQLNRMRYENDHWDKAIKGFRETEKMRWNPTNLCILNRMKKLAFKENSIPLKYAHILDLEENGVIMPHIDSIKFCGTTIAGISLLSDSVMRLVHNKEKTKTVDIFLKRRSLYIMTGSARYNYTHEILGNDNSKFKDQIVRKSRRISIICRNEP